MALNIGELTLQLGLDVAALERDLKAAQSQIAQVGEKAEASMKQATASSSNFENSLEKIGKKVVGVLAGFVGFAAITSLFKSAATAGVDWNKQLEVSSMKWETLLGSQAKAQEQLQWMQKFAAATPFEFQELDKASVRFKAFGFTLEQTRVAMQVLGDTAAATGTGSEGINRLTIALGQMQAKTKVSAQEMMQLTEMGIPAWDLLAKTMGTTVPELMKLTEKGLVPAGKAIPALLEGMNAAFGGQMQKQAETFTGKLSTLRDNVSMLLGDAFKPLFEYLKNDALPKVMELVDKMAVGFKSGGLAGALLSIVPPEFKPLVEAAGGVISALLGLLKDVAVFVGTQFKGTGGILLDVITGWMQGFQALAEMIRNTFNAVKDILVPLGKVLAVVFAPLVLAIGSTIAAGGLLIRHWEQVQQTAVNIWGGIKGAFDTGLAAIMETLSTFFAWTSRSLQALLDYGARLIPGLGSVLQSLATKMANLADAAAETADRFRQAADDERKIIQSRSQDIATAAGADFYAEQSRQAAMDKSAIVAADAAGKISDAYKDISGSAGASVAAQKEYLDAFSTAFAQKQADLLTAAKRADEDQLISFKRANDEKLAAFKNIQEQQKTEYENGLADQKTVFGRAQQDELRTFESGQAQQRREYELTLREAEQAHQDSLDQRMRDLEAAQRDELETFQRTQRDMLDAFKDRQNNELDALRNRRDAERTALDATFGAQMDALKAQQDAIQATQRQTDLAKRMQSLQENLTKAEQDLVAARQSGDPDKVVRAEQQLAQARDAIAAESVRNAQQAELERIRTQMESLRTQQDVARKASDAAFKAEEDTLRDKQALALRAEQDRLAAQATANGQRLNQVKAALRVELDQAKEAYQDQQKERLIAYQAEQKLNLEQFKREQDDQKIALDRQLADLKQAFSTQAQEALTHFQNAQSDQEKALQRQQDDRQEAYKRGLEALKDSFAKNLDAQQKFLDDWANSAATMAALQPPPVDLAPITAQLLADQARFVADWNANVARMQIPVPGGATVTGPGLGTPGGWGLPASGWNQIPGAGGAPGGWGLPAPGWNQGPGAGGSMVLPGTMVGGPGFGGGMPQTTFPGELAVQAPTLSGGAPTQASAQAIAAYEAATRGGFVSAPGFHQAAMPQTVTLAGRDYVQIGTQDVVNEKTGEVIGQQAQVVAAEAYMDPGGTIHGALPSGMSEYDFREAQGANVPGKAAGGVVLPSPGGSIVRVAEAGEAEAIIPLSRLTDMMRDYAAGVMSSISDWMLPTFAMPAGAGAGGGDVWIAASIYLGDGKLDEVIVRGLVTAKKRGRIKPDSF